MELDDAIHEQIEELSEDGNAHMDERDFDGAIRSFEKALLLLPAPQQDWDAYAWLMASIGDAHFQAGRFAEAFDALMSAHSSGLADPNPNPFILLRLGQSLCQLGRAAEATQYLAQGYMLGGPELFEGEDPKHLAQLAAGGFKLH